MSTSRDKIELRAFPVDGRLAVLPPDSDEETRK